MLSVMSHDDQDSREDPLLIILFEQDKEGIRE